MRVLGAMIATAVAEAWTNRRSFWLQVSFMIANDLALIAFWVLFFGRVGTVRGWATADILLLFAILATVTGVVMGVFANARRLGQMIADGDLDSALALPVDPLVYLLTRRVDPPLLGDLLFGPIALALAGPVTARTLGLYLFACVCASILFLSFLVILGSLTFFTGGRGEPAELGFQAILMLASYPIDLFGGFTKLLLFTAIPAAFVTGLPSRLVSDPSWSDAAAIAAAALVGALLARLIFDAGLARYRSGALWTRA